ncbi:bacteriocin biosynthesis protein SagD [Halomicrobium mukohataei]|uniref:Bacteriocin biosynthesis protein SagD n=1 Tax=Halomicrobium mukohataei TaxID=57705 RepID=A0A847UBR3_9EURY|nr:YcaO-like family protein [Halomicrobium mukohataei]NLV10519.1 bacteriocin biosynthesis protein SagD [Halomicrobium mukohataei]
MGTVVDVVGSGPATESLLATLEDLDVGIDHREAPAVDSADFAVVVGETGAATFETASEQALDGGTPWIAVEIGGIGGQPTVPASIAGFDPDRECYDCLRGRVEANTTAAADGVDEPGPATRRVAGAVAGAAVADYLADEPGAAGSSVLGHVVELPRQKRRFFPLPGCSCGGERDTTIDRTHATVDTEQALERAERALDDRVGIVQQVGEAESFPAPYYLAQLTDTSGFSDVTAPRQAAGVAADWDGAFMKALGESYERYAAGVYTAAETTTATAASLDDAVAPEAFVAPEDTDADATTELDWIGAQNLATDESALVPAELVFHPPTESRVRPPLTTGLGLGSSGCEALLAGLYEVIERDAAMLSWYSTFEPLGLTVDDDVFGTLYERAASEGLTVTPLLLTQDVDVPVVAVAVHRDEWPSFAIGSAADLDPEQAALGALEEALQNWMELRSMGPEQAAEASGAIGEYADKPERAVDLLAYDQTIPAEAVGPDAVDDGEAELDALVTALSEVGLTPYATRTTTRDLDELGFEGVRVLVPEAQPLFLGDAFFGERAATVPNELGFEPRLDRPHHPFP